MQPHTNTQEAGAARFALGEIFITPEAEKSLQFAGQTATEFLRRHVSGDWGEVPDEDVEYNELSVEKDGQLLSCYRTSKGEPLWIVTAGDRRATSVLLPSNYFS